MNQNPYAFRLGLFVIAGLLLGLGGLFAIGFSSAFEPSLPLYCYFFENVSGLEQGSQVRFRGVQIGSVDSVRVLGEEGGDVATGEGRAIEVRSTVYPERFGIQDGWMFRSLDDVKGLVRRMSADGLRVRIAWADITGQKYLDLDYLDPEEFPQPDLRFAPHQPYVPTAVEPSFTDIQRDLATTVSNVSQVDFQRLSAESVALLERLNEVVAEFGEAGITGEAKDTLVAMRRVAEDERIPRLLDSMNRVAERLDRITVRAEELATKPELEDTIDRLADVSRSMERTTSLLEERLPVLLDDVDRTLATAREAVEASDLPATTESVRGAAGSVEDAARDLGALRGDLRRTLQDLSTASRSIARLARYLEERPDALLRGREP